MFRAVCRSGQRGRRLAWSVLLVAALAACGGGGGGDDGGGSGGPPGSIDISTSNRESVTRAAMVTGQGGMVGGALGIAGGGSQPQPTRSLARALLAGVQGASPREAPAAVIGPQQLACAISGSASVTLDDRDNNQTASVGDVLGVVFSACSDLAGETLDGNMSATYTQVVRSPLTVGATVSTNNLRFAEPGLAVRLDGGFTFTLRQTSADVAVLETVAVNALALQVTTPVYSDTVTMQAGYKVTSTEDLAALPPGGGSAGRVSTVVSGQVSSAAAGGTVQVSTFEPIVQYTDDAYPRAGGLEALGKTGSLRATVLSTSQVRIDIDSNGDGSVDSTVVVPWTQLL